MLLAAIASAAATSCKGGPAFGYKAIKPVPGIIGISYESPAGWGPYLTAKGEAKDSWEVEILHPENRLVRMYVRKFALDPKRRGYPALTRKEHLDSFRRLRDAVLTPERTHRTAALELRRFTVSGRWIEVSGTEAPAVRREEAYLERNGFLYTVSYTAPSEAFAEFLPKYERLLETLRFSKE